MASSDNQNTIQDRVSTICNNLHVKGIKPSVRLVLAELPDISSTSTVHKYFAKWKSALDANQQSLIDKLGFSVDFTRSFTKEIARFAIEAEQRYKERAQDADDQRDTAIDELASSEERFYKQTAELEQQQKELKELQRELLMVQDKFKADLEKAEESNLATVTELRQQLKHTAETNVALTKTNETLRSELSRAEFKLESNLEYVAEVKSQNTDLSADNKKLNADLVSSSRIVATLEATILGNEKLIKNLESTASDAQKDAVKCDQERLSALESLEKVRMNLDEINKTFTKNKDQLIESEKNIETLQLTIKEQSSVIDKLSDTSTS